MSNTPNEGLPWAPEETLYVLAGDEDGMTPDAASDAFQAIKALRAAAINLVAQHLSGEAVDTAELEAALLSGITPDETPDGPGPRPATYAGPDMNGDSIYVLITNGSFGDSDENYPSVTIGLLPEEDDDDGLFSPGDFTDRINISPTAAIGVARHLLDYASDMLDDDDENPWECARCGVDTFDLGEDFYVVDDLWEAHGVKGVLCIGCLEARMGRKLTRGDFKCSNPGHVGGGPKDDDPHFPDYRRSDRFNDRVHDDDEGDA